MQLWGSTLLFYLALSSSFHDGVSQSTTSASTSNDNECSSTTSLSTLLSASTGCGGVCGSNELCLIVDKSDSSSTNMSALSEACDAGYAALECVELMASDSSAVCEVLCFAAIANPYAMLMVDYGSYKSDKELALRAEYGDEEVDRRLAEIGDDSSKYPLISNDLITSFGALELDDTITNL